MEKQKGSNPDKTYPYMLDGMTMYLASGDKNRPKAAKKARDVAYWEDRSKNKEPSSWENISADLQKYSNTDIKIPVSKSSIYQVQNLPNLPDDMAEFIRKSRNILPDAQLLPAPEINFDPKAVNEIREKEKVSYEHAKIINYAKQWKDIPEYKWTLSDIAKWKSFGGDKYIHEEKIGFIKNYKDVIKDASDKYDIPPLLLAGVAYVEYGGDPMFLDDSAYTGRSLYNYIDKSIKEKIPNIIDGNFEIDQDKTSFGNVSIQVRRAIDTLEYNTSTKKRGKIIDSLKDPVQNIYIAAAHLKQLKDIDFKESAADKLTDDDIKIIASRYNVGPEPSLEEMRGSTDYGTRIYDNQDEILTALGLLPQSTKEQNIL